MPRFEVRMLDDSGAVVHTAAASVPAGVPGRFFAAYRAIYNLPAEASEAELWQVFAGGLIRGVIANITNHERETAAAAVEPPPIEFAPVEPPA